MKIIMVRHGQIDANVQQVYAGRSDDPLNETGRQQARDVARQLEGMAVSAIFSSPLRRTMETATIIGEHLSCKPMVAEAFNELVMGPWQGLSESEVAARYPREMKIWMTQPATLQIPGRETLLELQQRALAGLGKILTGLSENTCVVLVSHVAVMRVLALWSSGRDLNDYKQVHIPNATPLELGIPGNAPSG
jgi:broad specificity phosphatase PhoE